MNKPKDPDCANTTSYDYVPLLAGWEHYKKFNFYVMTVLHIFVPFAILVILNISIVVLTKRKNSWSKLGNGYTYRHAKSDRNDSKRFAFSQSL
ncbi:hypothetical protein COOONC_12462 [Cooperia oncophora]